MSFINRFDKVEVREDFLPMPYGGKRVLGTEDSAFMDRRLAGQNFQEEGIFLDRRDACPTEIFSR